MKVLISSTCYDLKEIRRSLKKSLTNLGYSPISSDLYDILYDPSDHSHISCIKAVETCDIVLLIIGKRYGGEAVPKVLDSIKIPNDSNGNDFWGNVLNGHLSITQAEIITAFQKKIPVFCFIDKSIMPLHELYQNNKKKKGHNNIEYPGFKKGTAPYVFEFINNIRLAENNNAYFEFEDASEILEIFKKQLILKFQELISSEKKVVFYSNNYVFSKIVGHNSKERMNSFAELFTEIDGDDEIKILGTGVTKFLSDKESVETFLKEGNKIKILLINDKIIKEDWECTSKKFIDKLNIRDEHNTFDIIEELDVKTLCPLSLLNVLVDKKHFLKYYNREHYIKEMSEAYNLISEYKNLIIKNSWTGTLDVKHFFSLVPLSITAILPDHSPNRKLLVEFIIPFTSNRILLKSSLSENKEIYNTFMNFFDETWKRAKEITETTSN